MNRLDSTFPKSLPSTKIARILSCVHFSVEYLNEVLLSKKMLEILCSLLQILTVQNKAKAVLYSHEINDPC